MANGISKNPLTDIGKVYLTQIAEGSLKSLEKASVLAMSDDTKEQDKATEKKTRFDYQSLMKQKKAKKAKVTEARSDWRSDLREIISADKASDEPEIKEKKIKNKIEINPSFKEAVEEIGGELLEVQEMDPKKQEQIKKKEKQMKKRMLMMKMRAVQQGAGDDVVAGYEPEGEIIESRLKKVDECWKTHKQQGYKKKGGRMVPNCVPKNEEVQFEAKVDQGKDDAAKINTRNQRAFGNRRGQKGGMHRGDDMEARRYNTEKGRGVKMKGKKDKTPVDYHGQDRKKRIDALFKEKGIKEATRYAKETGKSFKSGKPMVKGGTAKNDKAFQAVAKKYAGQMMGGQQKKKGRGQKPDESNTPFKRAAARVKQIKVDNKALADKAKKAGYKSTQDYVNVQAVRKGGLGT